VKRWLLIAAVRFLLPLMFLMAIYERPRLMLANWRLWPKFYWAIWNDPL
jgi:hypothetical protein